LGKPQERTFRYLEKVLHLGKPQERTFRYLEKVLHLSGRVTCPVGKPQEYWAGYPTSAHQHFSLSTVNCLTLQGYPIKSIYQNEILIRASILIFSNNPSRLC